MVDMHIHTKYSDGEYSVAYIINKLRSNNIKLFSITDHDNINSCLEVRRYKLDDIIYIPGIEFSSKLDNINCHILGYNFDYNSILIQKECSIIKQRRIVRMLKLIEYLNNIGIFITENEFHQLLSKKGSFGRMDICKLLMNKGYGRKEEIYDKFLDVSLPTHRSNASDIINVINQSKGISVLAHPKEIEEDYNIDIEDIIVNFLDIGLDGIEVYNSIHTLNDVKRYLEIARKYDLIITGGSDFHGSTHPGRVLCRTTTEQKVLRLSDINFSSKR